jgi:hypothetical protein
LAEELPYFRVGKGVVQPHRRSGPKLGIQLGIYGLDFGRDLIAQLENLAVLLLS